MSSDDEGWQAARHNVDNDFEDGEWIGGEFIYSKRKKGRVQTKEDAIYGVFNTVEDSPPRSSRPSTKSAKPVSFVKSDTAAGSATEGQDSTAGSGSNAGLRDAMDVDRPSLGGGAGLGMGGNLTAAGWVGAGGPASFASGGGGAGLGAGSSSGASAFPTAFGMQASSRGDAAAGVGGQRKRQRDKDAALASKYETRDARAKRGEKKKAKSKSRNSGKDAIAEEIQNWNKHTKGVGLALMQKMGYKLGEGLGSEGQGISDIVHVKVRKKGAGLTENEQVNPDFSKLQREAKKRREREARGEASEESGDDEGGSDSDGDNDAVGEGWRANTGATPRAPRRSYKVVTQVKNEIESRKVATDTIIDMRGPEMKVLAGLDGVKADDEVASKMSRVSVAPELQYNVRELVSLAEIDLQKADRNTRRHRETISRLEFSKRKLTAEVAEKENRRSSLQQVLDTVTRVQGLFSTDGADNDDDTEVIISLFDVFDDLQSKYNDVWYQYNLRDLVPPLLFPRFKRVIAKWTPIAGDEAGTGISDAKLRDLLAKWQPFLDIPDTQVNYSQRSATYWVKLVIDMLLPKIRTQFTRNVDMRNPAPFIDFIEQWKKILTPRVVDNILTMLVLPRLQREVSAWNPRQDPVPIHVWVHPWLLLMRHRIATLWTSIRQKLAAVLTKWSPSDASAMQIISPWDKVVGEAEMISFVTKAIVPKLVDSFRTHADPDTALTAPFEWCTQWLPLLRRAAYTDVLLRHFFPKWFDTLYDWLSTGPPIEQVQQWYKGWRARIPSEVQGDPRVKAKLMSALDMMAKSAKGQQVVMPTDGDSHAAASQSSRIQSAAPKTIYKDSWSFRDVIEKYAAENGIEFMPVGTRRHEGKQVFSFGEILVYIDNGVLFMKPEQAQMSDGQQQPWQPVSLDNLALRYKKIQATETRV